MTNYIAMIVINLVTPNAAAKQELLFNKPASGVSSNGAHYSLPGSAKLTGENLKVVWAEFSTLS